MNQSPAEFQKRKRSFPRRTGCLKLLLIPLFLAVACYGGMWVFARYGGEWAMSDQIPIPPESQLIEIDYGEAEARYNQKSSLYFHPWTSEQINNWFWQAGIILTPTQYTSSVEEAEKFIHPVGEDIDTYLTHPYTWAFKNTFATELHRISTLLTSDFVYKMPPCEMIVIYKNEKYLPKNNFNTEITDDMTAFTTLTCWPNVK